MRREVIASVAAVILWPLLTAGSCATTQGPVQFQRVEVPVVVKCGSDPGPDPQYADTPDAIRTAEDIYRRVQLLLAGRDQRDARLVELKAAGAGCQ